MYEYTAFTLVRQEHMFFRVFHASLAIYYLKGGKKRYWPYMTGRADTGARVARVLQDRRLLETWRARLQRVIYKLPHLPTLARDAGRYFGLAALIK